MFKDIIEIFKLIIPIIITILPLIVKKDKNICIIKSRYFKPGRGQYTPIKKVTIFLGYCILYVISTFINALIVIFINSKLNNVKVIESQRYLDISVIVLLVEIIILYFITKDKHNINNKNEFDKQITIQKGAKKVIIMIAILMSTLCSLGIIYVLDNLSIEFGVFYIAVPTLSYLFFIINFCNLEEDCALIYKYKIYFKNNSFVECDEVIDIGKKLLLKINWEDSISKRANMIEVNKENVSLIASSIRYKQY